MNLATRTFCRLVLKLNKIPWYSSYYKWLPPEVRKRTGKEFGPKTSAWRKGVLGFRILTKCGLFWKYIDYTNPDFEGEYIEYTDEDLDEIRKIGDDCDDGNLEQA